MVGRTQRENEAILTLKASGDLILKVQHYPGPLVLVPAHCPPEDLEEAAALTAAYSDAPTDAPVTVIIQNQDQTQLLHLTCLAKEHFKDKLV